MGLRCTENSPKLILIKIIIYERRKKSMDFSWLFNFISRQVNIAWIYSIYFLQNYWPQLQTHLQHPLKLLFEVMCSVHKLVAMDKIWADPTRINWQQLMQGTCTISIIGRWSMYTMAIDYDRTICDILPMLYLSMMFESKYLSYI